MPVAPQPSHGYFYPRSPCGERLTILLITVTTLLFLSTLSLRRATSASYNAYMAENISIHALLAESDCFDRIMNVSNGLFLSTLSLRRATELNSSWISSIKNFYPRSPCGERPIVYNIVFVPGKFLSTLSLRRATGETT